VGLILNFPRYAVVSSYVYVNPVVAVLLGALFAGEKISLFQIGSLALILVGVLLVNSPKYKTTGKPQLSAT